MKKLFILLMVLPFFLSIASCTKSIDNKKKNVLMDIITNGSWVITSYKEGNKDITTAFTGYEFFFMERDKVKAVINGQEIFGNWTGNISDYSIVSEFPGSQEPLNKLNGKWIVKDSDHYYVKAIATINSTSNTLEMKKRR